jgi:hypothetical protein
MGRILAADDDWRLERRLAGGDDGARNTSDHRCKHSSDFGVSTGLCR